MNSLIILLMIFTFYSCSNKPLNPRHNLLSYNDYKVLIVPTLHNSSNVKNKKINLIDKKGKIVNSWNVGFIPFSARLDKYKNIYISGHKGTIKSPFEGGTNNYIEKRSYDGEVLWSYTNELKHHDFYVKPNGNILLTLYSPIEPSTIGVSSKGKKFLKGKLWMEKFIEIDPKTERIVWEWNSDKHFKIKKIKDINYKGDVFHANSLSFIESFYLTKKPAVMFSSRNLSKVYIIDVESKEVIWESPSNLFTNQHDANFISDSKILVFNNNRSHCTTSIIEYDIKNKKVTWEYLGGLDNYSKATFYSAVISGAQRLSNGNTLITLGTRGYLVEVDKNKKVKWNYFNVLNETNEDTAYPYHPIFKARAYLFNDSH